MFYTTISGNLVESFGLSDLVEEPDIARTLLSHCIAIKVSISKFHIELKKAAGFFYSIFNVCISHREFIDYVKGTFLEDIFKDFDPDKLKSVILMMKIMNLKMIQIKVMMKIAMLKMVKIIEIKEVKEIIILLLVHVNKQYLKHY